MNFGFIFTFCAIIKYSLSVQCISEDGSSVDWLVLYKVPKINHENSNIAEGSAYLYITSESLSKGWTLSVNPVTSDKSIPGRIISQISDSSDPKKKNDLFWIFYNDEVPDSNYSYAFGHTKGVVIGNEFGGLWLVHSVPLFPVINEGKYRYPESGLVYGQSFLCISVTSSVLNDIGTQLIYNHARVYECEMNSKLTDLYPTLYNSCQMVVFPGTHHQQIVPSLAGASFLSLAKSADFDKDLYSDWVAERLMSELYVESWMRVGVLPTVCNQTYPVHNIKRVLLSNSISFESTKDHSKWAVTVAENKPWVCIGDINRARDQLSRGGGTVCIENATLWQHYFSLVSLVDPCPKSVLFYLNEVACKLNLGTKVCMRCAKFIPE